MLIHIRASFRAVVFKYSTDYVQTAWLNARVVSAYDCNRLILHRLIVICHK